MTTAPSRRRVALAWVHVLLAAALIAAAGVGAGLAWNWLDARSNAWKTGPATHCPHYKCSIPWFTAP